MRCLLALVFGILVPRVVAQDVPAPIPVVKTLEQLQTVTPIDLGGGVKIRLGLEATKVPQWSGALLYCLTEGYTPPSNGSGVAPFGPVHADFWFEEEKKEAAEVMRWEANGKSPKGTYLYVRALPIDRVGTYHVAVTDRQGKVLAIVSVDATKDFFHPWMPWLEGVDQPVTPSEGIALPSVDTLGPAAFFEPGSTIKGYLPRFLPADEKPRLTIKMEGKEIVIRAEAEFTTSRPDRHFLARWWVNDKPFVPKQTDKSWEIAGYGRVSEDKELRLDFRFRPERLGAKPGDKIGLQLMHSEGGWAWCAGSSLAHGASASRKHGENVSVSNRIAFEAPRQ
jgi:hypothetical protein